MKKLLPGPLFLLFLVSACGPHPLDIPDAEWEELSPAQQAVAHERAEALTAVNVEDRQRFLVIETDARRARVERRRQRMRLGDSLDCALRNGVAWFPMLGWHPVEETGFRIIRGDRQGIPLPALHADDTRPLTLDYSDSGLSLRLCGDRSLPTTCTTVAAPWHDLKDGMTWQATAPGTLAATLRCAFTPGAPVSVWDVE